MLLLIIFAFIAGIVTILSPCILPVLPIILTGTTGENKSRPVGIILGFIASFTFFTLFLTQIVRSTGISADVLRLFSVVILFLFGLSLLIPAMQALLEKAFNAVAGKMPNTAGSTGLFGGVLIGLSLGLLWTPCVGPILASVISLALTGSVNSSAFFITFAYALGTAIPMFIIMIGGQRVLQNNQWLLRNTGKIQKAFGVLMILTSIAIYFNYDRKIQVFVLDKFPQYGAGLTQIENQDFILNQLDQLDGARDAQMGRPSFEMLDDLGVAPELRPDGEWINSEPLSLEGLRGKVVLIDFWTYSCINCIRTLPYLREWHEKYADQGLVIIGVHSPEFEFEKKLQNLQKAVEEYELEYPIVQDNEFRTWRAYNNRFWPAKYLIDRDGHIRYTHFGEGAYAQTERNIQQLLEETGSQVSDIEINTQEYNTYARTPEIYLGYLRQDLSVSPERIAQDEIETYSSPSRMPSNRFGFVGDWLISSEYAQASPGSKLILNFNSKDVFLVMTNDMDEVSHVRVKLDGELVEGFAGTDAVGGMVNVSEDRLYHLIELDTPGQHILELEFIDPDTQAFAFTFG